MSEMRFHRGKGMQSYSGSGFLPVAPDVERPLVRLEAVHLQPHSHVVAHLEVAHPRLKLLSTNFEKTQSLVFERAKRGLQLETVLI